MPDKVNLLPNLRVDIPDLKAASQDFSEALSKLSNERFVLDNFSRIAEGFRIEIANQGTAPGQFTVFGGVALDRNGQIINNETDLAKAVSPTALAVDATYFVEVEFTSSASTTDARAFWDSEYDNGSDPSGDVRQPGRETYANVATRLTPDWRVVTPISTTGFQSTTNANSTRIPVAVITLAGGVITGASTSVNKTILLKDAAIAGTTIKCVNTRTFPDTFTATVGGAAITVTANDRENGVLTLSAGLAAGHTAGERVIQTGVSIPLLLVERTVQSSGATSGTVDQRPRLLQGDEEKGYVYSQDPYTTTGRSDLNLRTNKELFDFYSGQIREMKFGSMRSADLGKSAPPSTFSSPRYFDNAGGLLGARIPTVSVGDGTTVWGDFNTAQYAGSARDAIQAAHDALPARGGIIFIKGKDTPYDISTTTVTITKNIIFMGENAKLASTSALGTELRGNGAIPAITVNADCTVEFYNLKISRNAGSTSTAALVLNNFTVTIRAENCHFFGVLQAAGTLYDSHFTNCAFNTAISGSNNFALNSSLVSCTFDNCTFANQSGDGAAARACYVKAASPCNSIFSNCTFTGSTAATAVFEIQTDNTNLTLEKCKFTGGTLLSPPILAGESCIGLRLSGCDATTSGNGLIAVGEVSGLFIRDCVTIMNGAVTGINIGTSSPSNRCEISGCYFTNTGGTATSVGININSAGYVRITDSTFTNTDYCIRLNDGNNNITIDNIAVINDAGSGLSAVQAVTPSLVSYVTINNVRITNLGIDSETSCHGISLDNSDHVSITNCKMSGIGRAAIATVTGINFADSTVSANVSNNQFETFDCLTTCTGIRFSRSPLSSSNRDININNNVFREIGNTTGEGRGIYSTSTHEVLNINNNQFYIIGSSAGSSSSGITITGNADSATKNNITIANNNIDTFRQGTGISVSMTLDRCNITNNIIITNNSSSRGIYLFTSAGSSASSETVVSGNSISSTTGSLNIGLEADFISNTGDGRFVVSNNVIRGFTTYGIVLAGASASQAISAVGNILESSNSAVVGILMANLARFTVNSNIINITSGVSAVNYGIQLSACTDGTINGNDVFVSNTSTGWNIAMEGGSTRVMISGNHVKLSSHVRGILGAGLAFIMGNMTTGAASVPISNTGNSRSSAMQGAVANNYGTTPTTATNSAVDINIALTDVSLNYHSTT